MIQFPKLHIAESVLNRIANTLEEQGPLGLASRKPAPAMMQENPIAPNPELLGDEIETKVNQPVEPIAVPPEQEADANNGMLEASVMGGSPFDGALLGAGG